MVDDERFRLRPGEIPVQALDSLSHARLLSAHRSDREQRDHGAEIIQEMLLTSTSERQGRAIDHDQSASMELKKQAGYF